MTSRKQNAGATGAGRGTVVGLFRSQADAERAIRDLKAAGIDESRIGVAMRDPDSRQESAEHATGAILGGAVGLLAGVGALAIPGVGPIIVGGALASVLAGAGVTAVIGGLVWALITMGVPETDARYFETGLRKGSVLVTATAGSRRPDAREILGESGADLGGSGREAAGDPDLFMSREEIMVGEETWRGNERRYHEDLSYLGPERRFSHR